jgi:hypothetical protein
MINNKEIKDGYIRASDEDLQTILSMLYERLQK